tara:strand:+ start:3291 stop:3464 length:174 start_codon:yes stop_codon:yes gene_type:complete
VVQQPVKFQRRQIKILSALHKQDRRHETGQIRLLAVASRSGHLSDLGVDPIDDQTSL